MSEAELRREVARLQLALDRLSARVPLRAAVAGGGAAASNMFQIIGGNDLPYSPAGVGVKKITTEVTEIPAGYADGSPSTTMDGVCWARRMDDDAYVLVVNDSLSLISHALDRGTPVLAVQLAVIPDDAAGSYTVWRVTGAV